MSMIAEPNINSPANVDAAKMWRDDIDKFAEIAQDHVRLSIEMPEKDYFPIPEWNKQRENSKSFAQKIIYGWNLKSL